MATLDWLVIITYMLGKLGPELRGVLPVVQTPYQDDESIDYSTLTRTI